MPRSIQSLLTNGSVLAVTAIILTAVIAYGTGIPRLGYYHDDWYMLWSAAVRGIDSFIPLFSTDRPFMGVIYMLTYQVIGENLTGWHVYALVWRIVGALAFYWILNLTWPKMKGMFGVAAVLFIIYPGFLSIPNAATKINHLIGFGAALISIAFTLKAIQSTRRGPKWALTAASLLLTAFYLWLYEYMIGLEIMRLLLMFWVFWQGQRKQAFPALKSIILHYIPYMVVIGVFLYWRVFLFDSTRVTTDLSGIVDSYRADPLNLAVQFLVQTMKDFFSTIIFAWGVQPYHLLTAAPNADLVGAFVLAACIMVLSVGMLIMTPRQIGEEEQEKANVPPYLLVLFGVLICLAAVAPVVATFRRLDLLDAYKSYGLHPSPGVIILVIGLVGMLKPRFRTPLLIALIGLSVVTQSLNTQDWARKWEVHRNFWWQLTWRAPAIADHTLLMALTPSGYAFQQDHEVWGPLNLIYHPSGPDYPLIQSEILNADTAQDVSMGQVDNRLVRDILVPRDYANFLLVSQPTPSSCIYVIDGQMPTYAPLERPIIKLVGEHSNTDLILTSGVAPTPPESIFGKEPERGWCYYFAQASLARQSGDWQRIGELYDAAAAGRWRPGDSFEYFVYIEGLVNAGRGDLAERIMDNGLRRNAKLIHSWCTSLASAPDYPASFGYRREELTALICQ